MKAVEDSGVSSCSRINSPGDFGPVSHCVKEALTASRVVPPVVKDQSNVLKWTDEVSASCIARSKTIGPHS